MPCFCSQGKLDCRRVPVMPRTNRLRTDGGVFHLTHRCHNRAFLLKFARDRDTYRSLLREHLHQYDVGLLDFCVTSNHVHLLVDTVDRREVSGLMQEVASEFARAYNRRKHRMNAFWGDNYHGTLVEEGEYLWECLCYIELNMVRAGAVSHPTQWQWLGYHEIMGERQRYRLLDLDRLCWRLRAADLEQVRKNLAVSLAERIARNELKRQARWTQSLAVGSRAFVETVQPLISERSETEIAMTAGNIWSLHEAMVPYGQETGPKNASKAIL